VRPRGFSLAGVLVNGIMIVTAIFYGTFSCGCGDYELANRTACSANLRLIMQSMTIYAQTNGGVFPCVPGPIGDTYNNQPQNPFGWNDQQPVKAIISEWYSSANSKNYGDPLGSLWLLVLQGQDTTKAFVCPSDPIANAASRKCTNGPATFDSYGTYASSYVPNPPAYYFGNFGNLPQANSSMLSTTGQGVSYSIAFPWAYNNKASATNPERPGSWWINDTSADVPIVCDMAPQSNTGTGTFYRATTTVATSNIYGPYVFNSGNHNGDGQNVGYADAHFEWDTTPYSGQNGNNIFTWKNSAGVQQPMTGIGTTQPQPEISDTKNSSPYDITMVPVRNVQTGAW